MFGGTFTTRPILDHAPSCALKNAKPTPCPEVQYALMDLPNFAIPEVEVDAIKYFDSKQNRKDAKGNDVKDDKGKVIQDDYVTSLYTVHSRTRPTLASRTPCSAR